MSEFLHWLSMGQYSHYVWPAYGLALAMLGCHVYGIKWQRRRIEHALRQWFLRQYP